MVSLHTVQNKNFPFPTISCTSCPEGTSDDSGIGDDDDPEDDSALANPRCQKQADEQQDVDWLDM